jgi:hypothetical protein
MKIAKLNITGLKVAAVLDPATLPVDLVPFEGPVGEPAIDLILPVPGGTLTVRAKINGKNYKKMIKQIAEVGPAGIVTVLQGTLRAPQKAGEPFALEGAGFQATVKTPRPTEAPAVESKAVEPPAVEAPPIPAPPVEENPSAPLSRVRSSVK